MFKFKCLQGKDRWTTLLTLGAVCCILAFPAQWITQGSKNEMEKKTAALEPIGSPTDPDRYQTSLESRVQSILEHVEGIGAVEVMIIQEEKKQFSGLYEDKTEQTLPITGMVVCADGGGSPVVQAEICEAMEALFGLPAHKIKVLKRVE